MDAEKVISGLFDKLKETDEATQRALNTTHESLSRALQGAQGNPQLMEQILSFYMPTLTHYYEKLGLKVDVSKLGLTTRQQWEKDFGKALDEEAKKAEAAKRGRGAPLLPGLGGK